MDTMKALRLPLLVIVLLGVMRVTPAMAETINCINITSVPIEISQQGVYCMKQHVSGALMEGSAITVTTNNVVIDCNGYKLGNLAAGPATNATGIAADGRLNVTVRNCGIRGFRSGVQLTNGLYRVLDNNFDQNTQVSILVSGDGSAVRGNEVIDTGGSNLTGLTTFAGIQSLGDVDIMSNLVDGVSATGGSGGTVYGIFTADMDSGAIHGNRVRNLASDGSGARRGIWNQNGNRNTVERNVIVMNGNLLLGDAGIRCGDGLILNGASRENTVLGTGLLGQVYGLINCTSVAGDYVNPL